MTTSTYLLELLKETRTRAELCRLTNLSDRQVRKAIEQLRKDGHMIISLEKGYRLAKDMAELETYLNKIHSYQCSHIPEDPPNTKTSSGVKRTNSDIHRRGRCCNRPMRRQRNNS